MNTAPELTTTQPGLPHQARAIEYARRRESGETHRPRKSLEGVIGQMHSDWTEGAGAHGNMQNVHRVVALKAAELKARLGENPSEEAEAYLKSYMDTTIQAMTRAGKLSRVITRQDPDGERMIYYNALPQIELNEDGTVAVRPVFDTNGAVVSFKKGAQAYAYKDPGSYIARIHDAENPLNSDELPAAYILMANHLQALESAITPEGQPAAQHSQVVGAEAVEQTLTPV